MLSPQIPGQVNSTWVEYPQSPASYGGIAGGPQSYMSRYLGPHCGVERDAVCLLIARVAWMLPSRSPPTHLPPIPKSMSSDINRETLKHLHPYLLFISTTSPNVLFLHFLTGTFLIFDPSLLWRPSLPYASSYVDFASGGRHYAFTPTCVTKV